MYLKHFKTVLCWPRPDRPCVHLTIVWWTLPLWKPVPCQRWHWHGWELWRSGTLGCQLLSLTWSRPRWLTLGLGAVQKWNHETISVWLDQFRAVLLSMLWEASEQGKPGVVIYPSLSRRHPLSSTIWPWTLLSHNLWIHFHGFMDEFNAILVLKPPRLKKLLTYKIVMA